jgi:hypothetical protein
MNERKKTHWLRTTILVLLVCGIIGVVLGAVLFRRDPGPTYASAALTFSFDGAAEGVAPNGTAFDLRDITGDEVLTQGLRAASLEGTYTPDQLRPCLAVQGVYPAELVSKVTRYESLLDFTVSREVNVGDYHPTTFGIVLYNDFDPSISREQLTGLLKGIAEAYRTHFAREYSYGTELQNDLFDLEDYDYPQRLQILEGYLSSVSAYARELYEKAPSYRWQSMGFNDIAVRLNNLIGNSIPRLNADMTINALTREPERLLTQYRYQVQDLGNQKEKREQELDRLDALISAYEKNEIIFLSTADSLTKIDGNSSETYDALVDRRKNVADEITVISSQIAACRQKMDDLLRSTSTAQPEAAAVIRTEPEEALPEEEPEETGTEAAAGAEAPEETAPEPTEEELAEAKRRTEAQRLLLEENIRALVAEGDEVVADFREMLENYSAQQLNDLTVSLDRLVYKTPRLLSGDFAKAAVKTAGPIMALGFLACMLLIIRSRRREKD